MRQLASLIVALAFIAACTPAAQPSPTAAPAKPAAATAPAAKPAATTAPAAKPAATTAPAAKPTEKPGAAATLSDSEKQAAEQFYRGKTVTVQVGSTAGGGYDTYARMFGRHFGKFIPGQPNVIVQNNDGGGGLNMMNEIYNTAPKDGTQIGAGQSGNLLSQLIGDSVVKFDATKYNYLGTVNQDTWLCIARNDAPAKTIEQAKTTPIRMATSGPTSATTTQAKLLNEAIGTKFEVIAGYQGGAAIDLSIEQGETHGRCGITASSLFAVRTAWMEQNPPFVNILVQMGQEKHPKVGANVPRAQEMATNPDDRALIDAMMLPEAISRPYFVAPGVPAERVKALRVAFDTMVKDKDFVAEMEKAKLELTPGDSAMTTQVITKLFQTPQPVRDRVKKVLTGQG